MPQTPAHERKRITRLTAAKALPDDEQRALATAHQRGLRAMHRLLAAHGEALWDIACAYSPADCRESIHPLTRWNRAKSGFERCVLNTRPNRTADFTVRALAAAHATMAREGAALNQREERLTEAEVAALVPRGRPLTPPRIAMLVRVVHRGRAALNRLIETNAGLAHAAAAGGDSATYADRFFRSWHAMITGFDRLDVTVTTRPVTYVMAYAKKGASLERQEHGRTVALTSSQYRFMNTVAKTKRRIERGGQTADAAALAAHLDWSPKKISHVTGLMAAPATPVSLDAPLGNGDDGANARSRHETIAAPDAEEHPAAIAARLLAATPLKPEWRELLATLFDPDGEEVTMQEHAERTNVRRQAVSQRVQRVATHIKKVADELGVDYP